MNYCSNCGSKDLAFVIPEGDNRPRYVCGNCQTIHYSNPNMVVGCLPVYEDKILLCKRAIEPRRGYWNLPAGYLENKETVEEGAKREVMEEAGIDVEIVRLHCIYSIPRISQVYCFFLANMKSPEWEIGEETLEAGLYTAEEIPYDEIAFPSSIYAIKKYLKSLETGFEGTYVSSWNDSLLKKDK
ncbi:MAG: NUDIX hydrolase [Bacteroidota bacterium]